MFIYNFKVSGTKIFKGFAVIVSAIVILLFALAIKKIFFEPKEDAPYLEYKSKTVNNIEAKNYTNILKAVHDDIDSYIGMEIKFSGYVYRVYDFKENQFVLARDMLISSDRQTLIVGFLCESEKITKIDDNIWVEITGVIEKGDYHGDIPIIKVTDLKVTQKPTDELVYPPDDTYIPTNGIV